MKAFTRTKEDFVCGHCKANVLGNGYTNHCPKCLYSRHVDVYPGDRAESCGGLMRPVSAMETRSGFDLMHRCERCGAERKNKTVKEDSFEAILSIARDVSKRHSGLV